MRAKRHFLGFVAAISVVIAGAVPSLAAAEIVVGASGETAPGRLGQSQATPVTLRVGFTSEATGTTAIPELSRVALQISRNVEFQTAGLPSCPLKSLYSRTASARTCAGSLVGHGSVASEITLPGKAPASVEGRLRAFYSSNAGVPHILAQITTVGPVALTYVLPFQIGKARGPFDTSLVVQQMRPIAGICIENHPNCFDDPYTFKDIYGHISHFEMSLHRRFGHGRATRSFVSALCPAAAGSPEATFPLVRANLTYEGDPSEASSTHTATASGRCEPVIEKTIVE